MEVSTYVESVWGLWGRGRSISLEIPLMSKRQ